MFNLYTTSESIFLPHHEIWMCFDVIGQPTKNPQIETDFYP